MKRGGKEEEKYDPKKGKKETKTQKAGTGKYGSGEKSGEITRTSAPIQGTSPVSQSSSRGKPPQDSPNLQENLAFSQQIVRPYSYKRLHQESEAKGQSVPYSDFVTTSVHWQEHVDEEIKKGMEERSTLAAQLQELQRNKDQSTNRISTLETQINELRQLDPKFEISQGSRQWISDHVNQAMQENIQAQINGAIQDLFDAKIRQTTEEFVNFNIVNNKILNAHVDSAVEAKINNELEPYINSVFKELDNHKHTLEMSLVEVSRQSSLQTRVQETMTQMNTISHTLEDLKSLQKEFQGIREQFSNLDSREEISQARSEIGAVQKSLKSVEEQMHEGLRKLEKEIRDLNKKLAAVESSERSIKHTEEQLRGRIESAESLVSGQVAEVSRHGHNIQHLLEDLEDTSKQVFALQPTVSGLQKDFDKLNIGKVKQTGPPQQDLMQIEHQQQSQRMTPQSSAKKPEAVSKVTKPSLLSTRQQENLGGMNPRPFDDTLLSPVSSRRVNPDPQDYRPSQHEYRPPDHQPGMIQSSTNPRPSTNPLSRSQTSFLNQSGDVNPLSLSTVSRVSERRFKFTKPTNEDSKKRYPDDGN